MKKKFIVLTVTALAVFGLSACSGGAEEAPANTSAESAAPTTEEVVPEETTEIDASTVQACMDIAGPFQEASAGMAEIVADGKTPPQEVVDMWSHLVDALGNVADSTSNAEVKTAATAAEADFTDLRDAMQVVYVEGDMSAMGDYTDAAQAIQGSYSELLGLCSP